MPILSLNRAESSTRSTKRTIPGWISPFWIFKYSTKNLIRNYLRPFRVTCQWSSRVLRKPIWLWCWCLVCAEICPIKVPPHPLCPSSWIVPIWFDNLAWWKSVGFFSLRSFFSFFPFCSLLISTLCYCGFHLKFPSRSWLSRFRWNFGMITALDAPFPQWHSFNPNPVHFTWKNGVCFIYLSIFNHVIIYLNLVFFMHSLNLIIFKKRWSG